MHSLWRPDRGCDTILTRAGSVGGSARAPGRAGNSRLAISLRKATYAHGSLLARGAFTANIPSTKYVKEAD